MPRLLLAMMMVLAGLLMLGPKVSRAQDPANTWTQQSGAFTVQWSAPWEVFRQEAGLVGVSDGSAVAVASQAFPVADINPEICLSVFIEAQLSPAIDPAQPVVQGKTSWRAYAGYNNFEVGVVDYFECQITPDGRSLATLAGGVPLNQADATLQGFVDFMGQWIVRGQGEAAPAVAGGGWRAGVIEWSRGSVYADLGLPAAEAGAEHLVLITDLTNWQAPTPELPVTAISLHSTDSAQAFPVDVEASNSVAASLGELPLEASGQLSIAAGQTRRVALAFKVDSTMSEPVFSLDGHATLLPDDGIPARFVILPPPAGLPALQEGVITSITDGRTMRVELAGKQERVRLIGLADPADDAAEERLSAFVGPQVLLESDPAVPDDNRLHRYVWATGDDGLPVLLNALLIEEQSIAFEPGATTARFDAMLGAGQANTNDPVSSADPTAVDPAAEAGPSEADLAYLTQLRDQRDFSRRLLLGYDTFSAAPAFDERFYTNMALTFQGWAIAYNDAQALTPTPAYAELHARFVAALEPLDTLAHQMEPQLDQWFAGEVDQLTLSGFDYDVLVSGVAAARPELESTLAEIDQALVDAGMEGA
jgi:hypothetical protein